MDDPKFKPGAKVLVDEGPPGVCEVQGVYAGLIPKVNDDLTIGSEPGYIYEVAAADGERHQAVEYNLQRAD